MKYQNKKNGKVAVEAEFNERFKTYTLVFEDGSSTVVTTSTFKRWYKKLEDEVQEPVDEEAQYVAEIMEQKKELGIECPPINEVEIVEQAIAAVKKMPAKKVAKVVNKVIKQEKAKTVEPKVTMLDTKAMFIEKLEAIEGVTVKLHDNMPNSVLVKFNGKSVFEIKVRRNGGTFYCRRNLIPDGLEWLEVSNYFMDARVKTSADNYMEVFNKFTNLLTIEKEEN